MTITEFFDKHGCTEYERAKLVVRLAEIRYAATLEMLSKVMRNEQD